MPQNPTQLTDPDIWLKQQQAGPSGQYTDPDEWLAKQPRPTAQDLLAPPPKETWGQWGKRVISGQGKGFLDSLADPEVLTGVGTGMALATAPAKVAIPAVGGAMTAVRAGQKLAREGKALTPREVAGSFIGGAAGEAGGRLLSKTPNPLARSEIDPLGAEVKSFFGKDVSAQQLTRSPKLDFMANVARTGLGGRKGMEKLEQAQSATAIEHLSAEAAKLSPTHTNIPARGTPTHPIEQSAGKQLQNTLGSELKNLRTQSKQQYGDFLSTYGPMRAVDADGLPIGPSVEQLHQRRSAMLERSRDAFRAGDVKGQADALKQAERAGARIKGILPPDAGRKYDALSGWYKEEINRLDNEMIYKLRQGTKGEDVMKGILSNKLKTFTELGDNVALDNNELFHALKKATPPKAWKQTQADLINEAIEASIDTETGILEHKKLANIWNGLSPESQKILFGTDASKEIQRTLAVLQRAQEGTKGGPGQLAISVRQPSSMLQLAQASMAPLTGAMAGGAAAQAGLGLSGATATAAIIATSPYIFYKALTTPVGRSLLIKAATAKGPAGEFAKQALQRYLSQESVQGAKSLSNTVFHPDEKSIPEPPK